MISYLLKIVNKMLFIFKRRNITNKHQADINNKTTTDSNQLPIITQWINSVNPTHFISIQLPEHKKTSDYDKSLQHFRKLMASYEYRLLGRKWHKKHLYFIAVAEHGHSDGWHYHLVFNQGNISTEQLYQAQKETIKDLKLPQYSIHLDFIEEYPQHVSSYCTKEIKYKTTKLWESDRIIPSTVLFNLSCNSVINK